MKFSLALKVREIHEFTKFANIKCTRPLSTLFIQLLDHGKQQTLSASETPKTKNGKLLVIQIFHHVIQYAVVQVTQWLCLSLFYSLKKKNFP